MRGNDVLAAWVIAEPPSPMPPPVAMGNKEEWLKKREEGRPAPWAPEPPIKTLLLPSRLEMGSWPPLAASAAEDREGKSSNIHIVIDTDFNVSETNHNQTSIV